MCLDNCFCEISFKHFIELENRGYKRAFHSQKPFHDILLIESNEIKVFSSKDIKKYANGIYKEIAYDEEKADFVYIKETQNKKKDESKFKSVQEMIRHTRPSLNTRFSMIEYFCKLISKRSELYDYFPEKHCIKRVDIDGKIEVCIKSNRNFILEAYLLEVEKFIDLDLEKKYKNLEKFYQKYGFGKIIKTVKSWELSTEKWQK